MAAAVSQTRLTSNAHASCSSNVASWHPASRQAHRTCFARSAQTLVPGSKQRRALCRTAVAATAPSADAPGEANRPAVSAEQLVNEVLEAIRDTDAGSNADAETRKAIDARLELLEQLGEQQGPPLENPLVFGNYVVAYVSTTERSAPAGGRFRSPLGKALFRTTALCQSVLPPDLVTNKVAFKLVGCLPGFVALRGRLSPMEGDVRSVRVDFERPVVCVGGAVLRIGPPSWVQLATTYLDERVRLGKGSRGSLFVFTRGGAADAEGMEQVGLQQTTPLGWVVLAALVGAMYVGAAALLRSQRPVGIAAGGLLAALASLFVYTLWRGGQQ